MQAFNVTGVPPIPAMTTDAERECYYRLAKEAAGNGAIVELGAWMGASSAWIAAGIRDSGVKTKAHVWDKFVSKPGHIRKVKEFYSKQGIDKVPLGPCMKAFRENLGPLMEFVEPHQEQIEELKWFDGPIALLITDAPKRIPAISAVLTEFAGVLQKDSIMAWQDFCHFPSYEIPLCLHRIRCRLEFVEAVVPGTTLVFKVRDQWDKDEVSPERFALKDWDAWDLAHAWNYWLTKVPAEKAALFKCGETLALSDMGETEKAVEKLAGIYESDAGAIVKKWKYLKSARSDLVERYRPLFAFLDSEGAFDERTASGKITETA